MARKKLVEITAGSFDPAKKYQVHVTRAVRTPCGTLLLRPANNPVTITGSVAAAIVDAIEPATVVEIE